MTDRLTLADYLHERGEPEADLYCCTWPACRATVPAFGLVSGRDLGHEGWVCGKHVLEAERAAIAETEAQTVNLEERWAFVRARRDAAIVAITSWALADGSPLSDYGKALHEDRVRALHRVTLDFGTPADALAWLDGLEPVPLDYAAPSAV